MDNFANNDDTISRAGVMDALNGIEISRNASWYEFYQKAITAVGTLPPTCHLLEDGTLIVTVPNLSEVHRVIVDEENSQYCKTFYQDGDEDDKPVHDCMTCRHADRMPLVYPCRECHVTSGLPSKWQPKEV